MRNDAFPMNDSGGLGIFLVIARALAPAPSQTEIQRSASPAGRKIGFLERLDRWFWAQQQRDIEAYLAQSADIHDLEQRMRNLERASWDRYN